LRPFDIVFVDDADLGPIVLVPLSKFFPHLGMVRPSNLTVSILGMLLPSVPRSPLHSRLQWRSAQRISRALRWFQVGRGANALLQVARYLSHLGIRPALTTRDAPPHGEPRLRRAASFRTRARSAARATPTCRRKAWPRAGRNTSAVTARSSASWRNTTGWPPDLGAARCVLRATPTD
jgi:hypothetical protein